MSFVGRIPHPVTVLSDGMDTLAVLYSFCCSHLDGIKSEAKE